MTYQQKQIKPLGFTIIELLVVVVVIAILAAITIVAYNGISNQAKEATLKSDLINGAKQLGITKVDTGSYPEDENTLKKSDTTSFQYSSTTNTFCLTATSSNLPDKVFHITESGSVQVNFCPGHISIVGPMQTFTTAQCSALTTFTGANNEAVIGLTDSRGGVTRTYKVAKLVDNKCWMLTNLKLGSVTNTITLTPSDSNVSFNFTLPQLTTTGTPEYDLPRAYGPVLDNNGSNVENYGYLYNWPAATAGATRTSNPATNNDAMHSICPANWRLASGGDWNTPTNEFSNLNARMNGLSGITDSGYTASNHFTTEFAANWLPNETFNGTLSGMWDQETSSFLYQGLVGYSWSRSADSSSVDRARFLAFMPGLAMSNHLAHRSYGFGVRCLLN